MAKGGNTIKLYITATRRLSTSTINGVTSRPSLRDHKTQPSKSFEQLLSRLVPVTAIIWRRLFWHCSIRRQSSLSLCMQACLPSFIYSLRALVTFA